MALSTNVFPNTFQYSSWMGEAVLVILVVLVMISFVRTIRSEPVSNITILNECKSFSQVTALDKLRKKKKSKLRRKRKSAAGTSFEPESVSDDL